ncbi:unnamed protein product [Cylicostephanus goldi]|uniref:ER membrane protein complex subunit 6 n=1 Tax=Cylicostephanus goldi TaxID=71465 RepID=A0A3P7MX90_CYLGO|nr:unnamed protein product [Cylicostephanus goldi]
MRNNYSSLEYSRTCQAAASGMAAGKRTKFTLQTPSCQSHDIPGILGLTGIPGFIFYFVTVAIQALFWEAKAGFEWKSYFLDRTLSVTYSIVGGLFTYILFWVFLYGMVHVY